MRGRIREEEAIRRRGAAQPVPASEGKRSERGRAVSSRRAVIVPEGVSPEKQGNRAEGTLTWERREGLLREKEPTGGNTMNTSRFRETVSTKQRRIAEVAQRSKGKSVWNIAHYIDVEWMYCAYELVRRDGARGIDGAGAGEYEANLWENLQSLVDRLKSGSYQAPPVKRVYIPKAGSAEKRPLGIPTYEDKILQRAVQMALEPIYEGEFAD
jgi:hypothetical protein